MNNLDTLPASSAETRHAGEKLEQKLDQKTLAKTSEQAPSGGRIRNGRGSGPRIAVVCSGLGHVFRGVETWAIDLGHALTKAGHDVTLFQGSGDSQSDWQRVLHCMKRTDARAERLAKRLVKLGGWKYGVGSGYQLEQTTFALKLWPRVRRDYDIVHTQDPWVALHIERLRCRGLSRPHVILAHGTEEPTEVLQQFAILQHLAPCYLEDWAALKPAGQQAFAIGNFVKTDRFQPGDRAQARAEWDLPQGHLIVLSVAAIKKHHKRVDYLLQEFAQFAKQLGRPATLVVAGGREPETDEVMRMGQALLGAQVRFLTGISRERMPSLYQTADVFALASLSEMMPIALLEAIASGLPIACSDTPTLRWMIGPGGCPTAIEQPGALAAQLSRLADPAVRAEHGCKARVYAQTTFSEEVIVREIGAMYEAVMQARKM